MVSLSIISYEVIYGHIFTQTPVVYMMNMYAGALRRFQWGGVMPKGQLYTSKICKRIYLALLGKGYGLIILGKNALLLYFVRYREK